MSRAQLNFLLDTLLLILFMLLAWCSTVVRFVFPPGPLAAGWSLWKLNYNWWCNFQYGLICVLAFGILIHIMLHWNWVCGIITSTFFRNRKTQLDDGTKTIYGVGLLIVVLNIIGVGIAAAALMIQGE